ncbi:hypothetical protein HHK36_027301 [Tetracentron sinense]|uniref:Alpha-glucan water dikinase phosphohistidine-like domain-containing protein n=1 Tax=Tetracentron sinense TaxID=13715 RepID=A0A835D695_TETSI|nr:hypothetical protein HHK36_027301 [Tetracentron sinense]
MSKSKADHWALVAKSILDRTRLALASKAEQYQRVLQPSAEYLGSLLGVDQGAVCFATCFDPNILADLQAHEGKLLRMKPTSADIVYNKVKDSELSDASSTDLREDGSSPSITLVREQYGGRYAISSEEFTIETVGAKSRNISYLKGKVPSWVGIPTSVAPPFGVFEKVLSEDSNQAVADKLSSLKNKLGRVEFSALGEIRKTVLQLAAPPQLVQELKNKMQSARMPWPGDEGEQRWEQAWTAIKKMLRRCGFIPPTSMSVGLPEQTHCLFIRRSIIFRSDSNGEDLEGYAGAGLYDSIPMDEEDKVVLDYSSDPLIIDGNFRNSILSSIARAGNAIEELYGSPQDIEGVVKDGKIFVVQTRPQM